MRILLLFSLALVGFSSVAVMASKKQIKPCWCWPGSLNVLENQKAHSEGKEYASFGSYGSETDWNNPQITIPLDYQQAQGKRIFYQQCVWCHADATPAGPSNRSNVSPDPPLMNDGAILNAKSDESLHRVIALGGASEGKSAMMPPYGMALSDDEINEVISYMRAIATPEYRKSSVLRK